MSVIDVTFSNPLYLRIFSLELATQPRRILAENRGKSAMPNPLNDAKKVAMHLSLVSNFLSLIWFNQAFKKSL